MRQVTLELADIVYEQAQSVAEHNGKSIEAVLIDWLGDTAMRLYSDEEILAQALAMLPQSQQDELSELGALNNEGKLTKAQRARLDELLAIYGKGTVSKAYAMREAVERGLRPRKLEEWAEFKDK